MHQGSEYFISHIASPGSMPGDGHFVGRFAPSPTGRMHAGNIFSALVSWLIANRSGGGIVLRIEDLDASRSKQEYIDQLMRDFEMLGLSWDKGPYFQQENEERYAEAYQEFLRQDLVYPCYCTRADLHAASAPHQGEKPIYPGTCRNLSEIQQLEKQQNLVRSGRNPSYRIIVPDQRISFNDLIQGEYSENLKYDCGDFVVRRTDGAFAYQLAVVLDDYDQGVNCVVRGCDLLSSTPQQLFLHDLLEFDRPSYAHVPLVMGDDGRRLSKRHADANLEQLLLKFKTPEGILGHIAFICGMISVDEPMSSSALLKYADLTSLVGKNEIVWN